MRRLLTLLYIMMSALSLPAQRVQIMMAGNRASMAPQQTQTEVKPGWRIVDIQLKSHTTRYLFGRHASQLTDGERPTFVISPSEKETLVDYALIRLVEKKTYRKLSAPLLRDNAYTRFEPAAFEIRPDGDDSFVCTPRQPLVRGEYILVNLAQEPQGELGDYSVYPFRVE